MKKLNIFRFTITLILLVTLCSCTTNKTKQTEFKQDKQSQFTFFNSFNPIIFKHKDIVYSNAPNGVKVFEIPVEDSKHNIGNIPFLWGIDRIGTIGDWSVISYNYQNCYIKTSDVIKVKDYDIQEEKNDVVIAGENGVDVYSMPYLPSELLGNIPSLWEIDRIASLDNGWSMISYESQNAFVKTSDLLEKVYLGDFQITYYCPCSICNEQWGAYDFFGNPLIDSTAAVDTSIIPFGTTFYITESDGSTRTCVARDIGGAIKGKHIDVFVNVPHNICETMGNSYKPVYIYKPIV